MEHYQYIIVLLFIALVFTPVTWQAIQRRKFNPPPMASHDRKLYRLWRSDPQAYERQYGEMDRHYRQAQAEKSQPTKK